MNSQRGTGDPGGYVLAQGLPKNGCIIGGESIDAAHGCTLSTV
jgi:hypothetical protein